MTFFTPITDDTGKKVLKMSLLIAGLNAELANDLQSIGINTVKDLTKIWPDKLLSEENEGKFVDYDVADMQELLDRLGLAMAPNPS